MGRCYKLGWQRWSDRVGGTQGDSSDCRRQDRTRIEAGWKRSQDWRKSSREDQKIDRDARKGVSEVGLGRSPLISAGERSFKNVQSRRLLPKDRRCTDVRQGTKRTSNIL